MLSDLPPIVKPKYDTVTSKFIILETQSATLLNKIGNKEGK